MVDKIKRSIVFVGRLENDTGVLEFLGWLRAQGNEYKVNFVGDGPLRKNCERYGKVHGFTLARPFIKKAEICIPGGYLSYIEAKQFGCKIITFPNTPLKIEYWKEIEKIKKFPSWDEIANEYLNLYRKTS